jgi:pSer/pThr/pTyr-binding forkhead associated (FHA) protein
MLRGVTCPYKVYHLRASLADCGLTTHGSPTHGLTTHGLTTHGSHMSWSVGRESTHQVCLDYGVSIVSRDHAMIVMGDGGFKLIDHSTNGTFVSRSANGQFIRLCPHQAWDLQDGDRIAFGAAEVTEYDSVDSTTGMTVTNTGTNPYIFDFVDTTLALSYRFTDNYDFNYNYNYNFNFNYNFNHNHNRNQSDDDDHNDDVMATHHPNVAGATDDQNDDNDDADINTSTADINTSDDEPQQKTCHNKRRRMLREHNLLTLLTEIFKCPICLDPVAAAHMTVPCAHAFCGPCLAKWMASGRTTCPLCRCKLAGKFKALELKPKFKLTSFSQ